MRSSWSFNLSLITLCLSLSACSDNGPQVQSRDAAAETAATLKQPAKVGARAIPVDTPTTKQPEKASGCADSNGIKPEIDLVMGKRQATSVLNVSFVETQPPAEEIDRILRACIGAAARVDPTHDILGTAWFRRRARDNPLDDEIISNYGALRYLSYQASTNTIDVREMNFNSK